MLTKICNWSAVLFISVVNLVIPVAVYRQALLRYEWDLALVGGAAQGGLSATINTADEISPLLGGGGAGVAAGDGAYQQRVRAVPDWLANRFPGGRIRFAEAICVTVLLLSVAVIGLNIYAELMGLTMESDGKPDAEGSSAGGLQGWLH